MDQTHFELVNPRFYSIPLQQIKPSGWLKTQLEIQAKGLSGHLDQFWPDIRYSRWFGGDQEGWERAPYWLDGVIPLAYLLGNQELIERISGYIDYIVKNQQEDGWLGPLEMFNGTDLISHQFHDVWPQFLICKALTQYFDLTGDQKVFFAIEKDLRCLDNRVGLNPLFNWGKFRWQEALLTIYWMYRICPEDWLIDLAVKVQAQGFNWKEYFKRWPEKSSTSSGNWTYMSHVVNNAMAIKANALWHQISGEESDINTVYQMINLLELNHGSLAGIFSGDECLAGKNPTQGTELCAVVEYAYSLEILLKILGDACFGDRLEKVIFNALPAAFLPDMWSHQYDQQINQVECSIKPRSWTTNNAESNIFGLEPNYGCCTANFSQGWPKFASHLWLATKNESEPTGLVAAAYAPVQIKYEICGSPVNINVITDYPFREIIEIYVNPQKSMTFPIYLRIPGWADHASCRINNNEAGQNVKPSSFIEVNREWHSNDKITLVFPMEAKVITHEKRSISIERGPLVYGLKIAEEYKQVNLNNAYYEFQHGDWEIYPKSDWNYGLKLSARTIENDISFEERPIGPIPFSPDGAPIVAHIRGRKIPTWQIQKGSAGELPVSPVSSENPLRELELIPYGCTNLRIAQFPVLEPAPSEKG